MFDYLSFSLLLSWCPYFWFLFILTAFFSWSFSFTDHLPLVQHMDAPIFDVFDIIPFSFIIFIIFGLFYLFIGIVFALYFFINSTFLSVFLIFVIAFLTLPIGGILFFITTSFIDDEVWMVRLSGYLITLVILPLCAYHMFQHVEATVYGPAAISKEFLYGLLEAVF